MTTEAILGLPSVTVIGVAAFQLIKDGEIGSGNGVLDVAVDFGAGRADNCGRYPFGSGRERLNYFRKFILLSPIDFAKKICYRDGVTGKHETGQRPMTKINDKS